MGGQDAEADRPDGQDRIQIANENEEASAKKRSDRPKWLNRMSSVATVEKPELQHHWLHASGNLAPLLGAELASKKHKWRPFNKNESSILERAWKTHLSEDERAQSMKKVRARDYLGTDNKNLGLDDGSDHENSHESSGSKSPSKEKTKKIPLKLAQKEQVDPTKSKPTMAEKGGLIDPDTIESQKHMVPMGEDGMFQVDLKDMTLYPAYWQGSKIDTVRASWFQDSGSRRYKPVDFDLVEEIEKGYQQIRPWQSSYIDELRSVLLIGEEGEAKMRYNLPSLPNGTKQYILFQDAISARLFTEGISSRIGKSFLTAFRGSKARPSHGGGKLIFRGYRAVTKHFDELAQPEQSKATKEDSEDSSEGIQDHDDSNDEPSEKIPEGQGGSENDTKEALQDNEHSREEVSHLVLIVHGIGQKLAATHDDFDFVHAVNLFRNLSKQQIETESGLKQIVGGRRIQYLPVKWRSRFEYGTVVNGETGDDEEDEYGVDDVTPKQGKSSMDRVADRSSDTSQAFSGLDRWYKTSTLTFRPTKLQYIEIR